MRKKAVAFILFWVLCGIEAAGTWTAYFMGKFPAVTNLREEASSGLLWGLAFGPFAAVVSAFASGFWKYGWRLFH